MTRMVDGLPVLEPLDIPMDAIDQFPQDEEVPEGCIVREDLVDDFDYQVDFQDVVYVTRTLDDGTTHDLHIRLYIPTKPPVPWAPTNDGLHFPTVAFVQGAAFHKQWIFDHMAHHVRLAQRGYVVASIEHRPSEEAPFPAQEQDAKTAIRFLRANADLYHVDVDNVALWGDSSGGHTALMAGFTGDGVLDTPDYADQTSAVKCIIDWYGPTNFALMNCYPSMQNHSDADCPEGFEIGRVDVIDNPSKNLAASPMSYLSSDHKVPPTLIVHGGADQLVPFNQGCRLYERMRETGQDVTFVKLAGGHHGFGGFNCEGAIDLVDEFLRKHLS